MNKNIIKHAYSIDKKNRTKLKKHAPFLLWFTGLSGSGKSTIANRVEQLLHEKGVHTYILDGDNIRNGLNKDLSFKPKDREENIRRIAEVSNLMIDAGLVILAAFISPYEKDREKVRKTVGARNMIEIYINTSLKECEHRDVKGLYKKARQGEIKNMTGISAPYEAPKKPEIEIKTEELSIENAAKKITNYLSLKLALQNE